MHGAVTASAVETNLLTNGSFEAYSTSLSRWSGFPTSPATGWLTNDSGIEIWNAQGMGVGAAPDGTYISEVNYNKGGILYQDIATTAGMRLRWSVVHSSRGGAPQAISVYFGAGSGNLLTGLTAMLPDSRLSLTGSPVSFDGASTELMDDYNIGWTRWSGVYVVPASQPITRMAIASLYPLGGVGNLVDDVRVVELPNYSTSGFGRPLSSGKTMVRAGSTVPVKFQVLQGVNVVSNPAVVASLDIVGLNGNGMPTGEKLLLPARPPSLLRFDVDAQQFILNWKTPAASGQCYRIMGELADGDRFSADVCTV